MRMNDCPTYYDYDVRGFNVGRGEDENTNTITKDGIMYVSVRGYTDTTYQMNLTCEGQPALCEDLWDTKYNDASYLDLRVGNGLKIDKLNS